MAVARKSGASSKEDRTLESGPAAVHPLSKRKGPGTQVTLSMILMVVGVTTVLGNVLFVRSRQKQVPGEATTLPHGHLRTVDSETASASRVKDLPKLPPGVMAWADDLQQQLPMHGDSRPISQPNMLSEQQQQIGPGTHAQHPSSPVHQQLDTLDWSLKNPETCEGYFGNGYSALYGLVDENGNVGAFNVATPDSVTSLGPGLPMAWCRVHPSTEAVLCAVSDVRMSSDKLTLAAGGEHIDQVIGRNEESELPAFGLGSFDIIVGGLRLDSGTADTGSGQTLERRVNQNGLSNMIDRRDTFKYLMLNAMSVVDTRNAAASRPCDVIVEDPVIFLTRVEYANLFHTSTDWYNAWQTARIVGLKPTKEYPKSALQGLTKLMADMEKADPRDITPRIPAHIVFLDGHNASPMDGGWLSLFLSVNYAKRFTARTCFKHAYFAPYGYHSSLSQGIVPKAGACFEDEYVRQYGDDFVRGAGVVPREKPNCDSENVAVLFIRRVHYLAHPRHNGQIVRRLDNEDEIYAAIERKASAQGSHIALTNGLFSSMSMTQQVQAIQDACIIMGAHGAGLSHVLLAPAGAHVFELRPPSFMRPHFISYAYWAGVFHHDWSLGTSVPSPNDVVDRLLALIAEVTRN